MSDFKRMLVDDYRLTTIWVLYFLPDYQYLLQEFIYQDLDIPPEFPRMHRLIDHWTHTNLARIKEVALYHTDPFGHNHFVKVDQVYLI